MQIKPTFKFQNFRAQFFFLVKIIYLYNQLRWSQVLRRQKKTHRQKKIGAQ
jgi:hypothetical protein